MKIYVNTANQPPTLSASLNAKTDATGVLQVYNSSFGSSVSQLKFKRGTTVPLEVVFADAAAAADVARLRVGVKLAGKFDDVLVVADETSDAVRNDDGTTSFRLKLTFDATAIDAALKVNSSADDDLASAAFAAEIEWENAAGERSATETVPATIANNVCRGTTSASGATAGEWTALMVIRMSWEEFSALTERNPDAIYVVPDAPDPVEEHDASPDAHAELIQKIYDKVAEMLNAAFAGESGTAGTETAGTVRLSTADTLPTDAGAIGLDENGRVRAAKASATAAGTVKLSTATVMGVNDAAVGVGSAGALRVASATAEVKGAVYLPASEASGLTSAAASLELLRTKATASSVACGATSASENCNQYSFVGPLSALGVTGAAADLNSVTFYRRANNTPNGDTQVYLRLLKKTVGADGTAAWQIASQSVNAVAFSAQNENGGKCGTFYMRRIAGVEPPTCAETVALVMVGAADAEATAGLQFGCKVVASTTGGVCVNLGLDLSITLDKGSSAVVPLVDVTWTPCAPAVGAASYDAPGVVQLSLGGIQIDDPLGIGTQPDGRIVGDMAQVRTVVNAAVAGVAEELDASVSELKEADAARYTKAEIDGVDTGAEIMKRMNEDCANLKLCEEALGEKLPPEVWEEYFSALEKYQEDPSEQNWDAISSGESNNPYYTSNKTIAFGLNVTSSKGFGGSPTFNNNSPYSFVYLPECKNIETAFSNNRVSNRLVLFCHEDCWHGFFRVQGYLQDSMKLILPNAKSTYYLFGCALIKNISLVAPRVELLTETFNGTYRNVANSYSVSIEIYAPNAKTAVSALPAYRNNLSVVKIIGGLNKCTNINNFIPFVNINYSGKTPLGAITFVDCEASFPAAETANGAFYYVKKFNQFIAFPSLSSGVNMFKETALDSTNTASILNSLPTWADGKSHVITFTNSPGIASTATEETFTVTDDDGAEYSLENCPTFNTDDEAQTLRKAYALAIAKKGWTVEI